MAFLFGYRTPRVSYRFPYSDEQKKRIKRKVLKMQKAGMNIYEIAQFLYTSPEGVYRILSWDVNTEED